jgi:hypothetical protein
VENTENPLRSPSKKTLPARRHLIFFPRASSASLRPRPRPLSGQRSPRRRPVPVELSSLSGLLPTGPRARTAGAPIDPSPSFPFHGRRSIDPSAHVCTPAVTNPLGCLSSDGRRRIAATDRPRRRPFGPSPVSAGVRSPTPLSRADTGAAYNGGGEGSRWRGTPARASGELYRWTPLEGIHSRARSNQSTI